MRPPILRLITSNACYAFVLTLFLVQNVILSSPTAVHCGLFPPGFSLSRARANSLNQQRPKATSVSSRLTVKANANNNHLPQHHSHCNQLQPKSQYFVFELEDLLYYGRAHLPVQHRKTKEQIRVSPPLVKTLTDPAAADFANIQDYQLLASFVEEFIVHRDTLHSSGPGHQEFERCLQSKETAERCYIISERFGSASAESLLSIIDDFASFDITFDGNAHACPKLFLQNDHELHQRLSRKMKNYLKNQHQQVFPHSQFKPRNFKVKSLLQILERIYEEYHAHESMPWILNYYSSDLHTLEKVQSSVRSGIIAGKWNGLTLSTVYVNGDSWQGPHFTTVSHPCGRIQHFVVDHAIQQPCHKNATFQINTSNPYKLRDYKRWLPEGSLICSQNDLMEPDADPITVARYKASKFEDVFIEDSSLDIEGERIGVNIKWFVEHLDRFIGKRAQAVSYLAVRRGDVVYIYRGEVQGTIVPPTGNRSAGFDSYFKPIGTNFTLAERKNDEHNPRYWSFKKYLEDRWDIEAPILPVWTGRWQNEDGDAAPHHKAKSQKPTTRRKSWLWTRKF